MITKKEINILVTNDDGVKAPGLLALAQSMSALGNVFVLAPDRNWSASGHVKTLDRALRVNEVCLENGMKAWACDGAPSDCVALAVAGFFKAKMDLVVSGINSSANIGQDVTYSGTVAAAIEAMIWGIPAVAMSLDQPSNHHIPADYQPAALVAYQTAQKVMCNEIPRNVLLNVNVPFLEYKDLRGFQMTRQGTRIYHDRLETRQDPRNRPYYWVVGDSPTGIAESGTDVGALANGYVSITPIQLDLTDHQAINPLAQLDWRLVNKGAGIEIEENREVSSPLLLGVYF